MQLFNRMNKKTPSNVNPSSGGRGPGNRYIMQSQNQGGNEGGMKKVFLYSLINCLMIDILVQLYHLIIK